MSNGIVSDEARSLYQTFKEIRVYLNQTPAISVEDRKKIGELLRVLKYKIEFDVLEESLKDDSFITSVVADIDTKLLHIDQERKEITDNMKNMQLVTSTRRLIALRRTSNELDRIKTYIRERQFDYYVEAMNAKLESTNELVMACNQVLRNGMNDYSYMFGHELVGNNGLDKEGLDLLFSIITNKELKEQLSNYLKLEENYSRYSKEKDDNNKFLKLIGIAKKNEVTVREYLKIRSVLSEDARKANMKDKENLATSRLLLENLSDVGIAGIFNKKQREQLGIDILRYETSIKEYDEKTTEALKLESILKNIGLGDVVVSLNNVDSEILTIEDKVAAFLKLSVRRTSFDVFTAQVKITEKNNQLDSKMAKETLYLNDYLNTLSNEAYRLITKYHDDVIKLFELFKTRDNNDFSPLLSTYILKVLSDAKSLSYDEINEICLLDIDIDALFRSYAVMNQSETKNIQEQLEVIAEEEESYTEDNEPKIIRKI